MSFSSEIKQELNKITKLSNIELVKYELIGYLISGNIDILERNIIRFSTESDYNINRFSKLLYNLKIEHNIEISGKNFIVSFKKNSIQEFVKIDEKQIFLKGNIQYEKNEENLKTLVIGVFMGSGSINNPEKKYHLEIIFGNEENLKEIRKILGKLGIKTKKMITENKKSIYIKEGEQIVDLLNIIGAHTSLLELENIRIMKEMRNNVNRLVNCETANLSKTVNAAVRQVESIKLIQEKIGLKRLPKNLQEVAELRLSYPDESLKELGEMLNPPVGKSGINHRLRKIEKIAEEIRSGNY